MSWPARGSRVAVLIVALLAAVVAAAQETRAASFVVNSLADGDDGSCDPAPGDCTLREAMNEADANGVNDTITFDPAIFPPGVSGTIVPNTPLPIMNDPVGETIDGTGAGVIINGSAVAAGDGLSFATSVVDGALAGVTIRNLTVRDFPGHGIRVCAGGAAMCSDQVSDTTIEGVTASSNGGDGIHVIGDANLRTFLIDCTANGNGVNATFIRAQNGDIDDAVVNGCTFDGNTERGINIFSGDGGHITNAVVTDNTATGNGSWGINLNASGDIIDPVVEHNTSTGNGNDGINLNAAASNTGAVLTDNVASNNDAWGVEIDGETSVANITIVSLTANGNDGEGIRMNGGAVDNILVDDCEVSNNGANAVTVHATTSQANVSILNCETSGNDERGINVFGGGAGGMTGIVVSNVTANDNGDRGININASGDLSDATVVNNTTDNNPIAGIQINAGDVLGDGVIVDDNVVTNNIDDGIRFDGGSMPPAGVRRINGNIVCGNADAGLRLLNGVATEDAEANWWGAATGPTHPSNVGGTGDEVIDGANGEDGTADFEPWIEKITATADPATAGQAAAVSFQFSDAAGTRFLGMGPGDLHGVPPFTITADNGTLTSSTGSGASVTEFINEPDGTLEVMLTPAAAGDATVTVSGPCGLDAGAGGSIVLSVAAAPLPTGAPAASPVASPAASPGPTAVALPETGTGDDGASPPLWLVVGLLGAAGSVMAVGVLRLRPRGRERPRSHRR